MTRPPGQTRTRPRPEALLRTAVALVLAVVAGSALAHACLGLDLLRHGALFPPCPFHLLTGFDCPGCGMTRAFLLLSQLRLGEAVAAHPAAPALLLAMVGYALRPGWRALRSERLAWGLLVAVLGLWIARALPVWAPDAPLAGSAASSLPTVNSPRADCSEGVSNVCGRPTKPEGPRG